MTPQEIEKIIVNDIKGERRNRLARGDRTSEEFFNNFSIEDTDLDDAALLVKLQNSKYYKPNRYISMIQDQTGHALRTVIIKLITSGSAFDSTIIQLDDHPEILTIEDFIVNKIGGYGLPPKIIEVANWSTALYSNKRQFVIDRRIRFNGRV